MISAEGIGNMKRSEMEQIIKDIIDANQHDNAEEIASYIVWELEERGILPAQGFATNFRPKWEKE